MLSLLSSFDNPKKYSIYDRSGGKLEEGTLTETAGQDYLDGFDISKAGVVTLKLFKDSDGIHIDKVRQSSDIIGYAKTLVAAINLRNSASQNSSSSGSAPMGKTYRVYEIKSSGGYKWYRVDGGKWIADDNGKWIKYTQR